MKRLSPLRVRDRSAPTGGGARLRGKDASVSSMERALRTLTPSSNSSPQTPRWQINGGRAKRRSSKSTAVAGEEAVNVAIRMRPFAPGGDKCAGRAWRASSETNSIVQISNSSADQNHTISGRHRGLGESDYNYDKVFGEDTNTCEIYNELVRDMVDSVTKDGINGTVFTYGQTSSGKTFTMQGCTGSKGSVGIIQLAAKDIFQSIKEEKSDNSNSQCSVRVSYIEIYNEELRDLLNDNSRKSSTSLIIREDKRGSIAVEGLKDVAVTTLEQLMGLFRGGELNKSVGSTKMNDRSSRSHAIFKIIVERKRVLNPRGHKDDKENSGASNENATDFVVKSTSVLNLVDLAGSESVRHTGALGMQKKEGGMINQSLLTLSKVLMSLGQKNPGHINYRDSKLTRILKPSLSGNARMAVICCISPSDKYIEETRSTLQFATRAKLVKTNAVANDVVEDLDLIAKLRLENVRVKGSYRIIENRLREMESMESNALKTQRELANLKKFIFSERSNVLSQSRDSSRRLSFGSELSVVGLSPPDLTRNNANSRDDLHIRPSNAQMVGESLIRDALDFKAKQLATLQALLNRSKIEPTVIKDKRYSNSMTNEERSHGADSTISSINEVRSPEFLDTTVPKPQDQDTDSHQAENEQLELKVASVNSHVEDLERKIDDLTSQKNDALDWIEELVAKSDQKDEKLRQALEARNQANKRCEEFQDESMKSKELLASITRDLDISSSRNDRLSSEAKDLNVKMSSMEAEINSLKEALDSPNESNEKVHELYLELGTAKEKNEMAQDNLRETKVQIKELLRGQREAEIKVQELQSEIANLMTGKDEPFNASHLAAGSASAGGTPDLKRADELPKNEVQGQDGFTSEYAEEKKALIDQIETYEEELSHSGSLLKSKSEALDDALFRIEKLKRDASQASSTEMVLKQVLNEVGTLKEENERLKVEQLHLKEGFNERCQKVEDLSSKLSETQYQLENAKQCETTHGANGEVDRLNEDNERLRVDRFHLTEDCNHCKQMVDSLSNELSLAHQQIADAAQNETKHGHDLDALKEENEKLTSELDRLRGDFNTCCQKMGILSSELNEAREKLDDATQDTAKVYQLQEENAKLTAECFRLTEDSNQSRKKINDLSNDFAKVQCEIEEKKQQETKRANLEVDGLKLENLRLLSEHSYLREDFKKCSQEVDNLSKELISLKKQLQVTKKQGETDGVRLAKFENEKSELLIALEASDTKVQRLLAQVQDSTLQNAKNEEVIKSLSRVQHLVEELSSENADLKRLRECLENRSHELQDLLSITTRERNALYDENEDLRKSKANQMIKLKKLSSERDVAIHENEIFQMKLDKVATDFEISYETVRSKMDTLLKDKKSLEHKIRFLEASKASVEDNADRILERDNAIAVQYDLLNVKFIEQTSKIAELQDEVNHLANRLAIIKDKNNQLSRDNCALKDMIQVSEARQDEPIRKKTARFGFRMS